MIKLKTLSIIMAVFAMSLIISCTSSNATIKSDEDIVNIVDTDQNSDSDIDSGDLPDEGDTGNTGNTGNTGDTGNTGNTGTICTPEEEVSCYTGPVGTENVGICAPGTKKCSLDGKSWGECLNETLPEISEICGNSEDDNCNTQMDEGCICAPDAVENCYTGPVGTENVGECKAGTRTCDVSGYFWGACLDSVLPATEIGTLCSDGLDNDCDGTADNGINLDGDLWTTCSGDCCDNELICAKPTIVNPGAVEFEGDTVDNDCNSSVDEARAGCSTGANITSGVTALNLLNAMDICQVHDAGKNSWGIYGTPVITRASGSGAVDYRQYAVKTNFGTDTSNNPIFGDNFAVLSTGRARASSDTDATTGITCNASSCTNEESSGSGIGYNDGNPPADFISAHSGGLPETKAGCLTGSGANDSVMLKVQLKVPTNANSFSFDFRFFSQEYWLYTCSAFNDFFITMLDTTWTPGVGETAIPADKNISFDSAGNYISVNTNQFFTVCDAKTGYPCPDLTGPLAGTGYNLKYCNETETWGNCTEEKYYAGATKWLTTTAPVVPGEIITLRFIIWDTSDRQYDSLVLIDNFKWNAEASGGPVTVACWDLNKNGICDVASEDPSGDGECNERDCKQ